MDAYHLDWLARVFLASGAQLLGQNLGSLLQVQLLVCYIQIPAINSKWPKGIKGLPKVCHELHH